MKEEKARPKPATGMWVVAALFLFGALFLWLLFALTDGKRAAPPR